VQWVAEKVGQENIVVEKKATCKPDSGLLGSGVGFGKET